MTLTLRAKLLAIVVSTALAFLVVIVASALATQQVQERLLQVEQRQIPKLEIGPRLVADLDAMRRAYQDAVAANDLDALERTDELRTHLLANLDQGQGVFDPALSAELRVVVTEYHAAAIDVSRRMIAGEGGERVVEAMAAMQRRSARSRELLDRLVVFDPADYRRSFDAARAAQTSSARVQLGSTIVCLLVVLMVSLWLSRGMLRSLGQLQAGFAQFALGRLDERIVVDARDEVAELATEANRMAESLGDLTREREVRDWVKSGLVELAGAVRGELPERAVADRAIRTLASYLAAPAAALYVLQDRGDRLHLLAHHALGVGGAESEGSIARELRVGEGLVGEAARGVNLVVVEPVPAGFLTLRSGLGSSAPAALALVPLVVDGDVRGVLELASFKSFSAAERELLAAGAETIAISLAVAESRAATQELLHRTQEQAAELAAQEEELNAANEELRQTNEELAVQSRELARVSSYKTDFLARMSHELRTPLNSMLLLSKLLAENAEGTMTAKQSEHARTVHSAGKELLALINQILDLSKIEAGKQDVELAIVRLEAVTARLRRVFGPLAAQKGLALELQVEPGIPDVLVTDEQRLGQVLTNLIGNAIKFTEQGEVRLTIGRPAPGARFQNAALRHGSTLAFTVTDTGPGIPLQHRERVFAPFEQAGGATRNLGGTGLGLTIARELAALLGGELQLASRETTGTTFVCYLPVSTRPTPATGLAAVRPVRPSTQLAAVAAAAKAPAVLLVGQGPGTTTLVDRLAGEGVSCVLATADGALPAVAPGRFPCVVVTLATVDEAGVTLLEQLRSPVGGPALVVCVPKSTARAALAGLSARAEAVVLEDGATSTERVVDEVRRILHPGDARRTRAVEPSSIANGVRFDGRRLLVVEDDMRTAYALSATLGARGAEVSIAETGVVALEILGAEAGIDAVIMDVMMPDLDGLETTRRIRKQPERAGLPIFMLTAKAMKGDEAACLEAGATAYLPKPVDADVLFSLLETHLAAKAPA